MAEHSRYQVSDETAGVSRGILKNKLGIKNKKRLDRAETLLLADTYTHFFELLKEKRSYLTFLYYFPFINIFLAICMTGLAK